MSRANVGASGYEARPGLLSPGGRSVPLSAEDDGDLDLDGFTLDDIAFPTADETPEFTLDDFQWDAPDGVVVRPTYAVCLHGADYRRVGLEGSGNRVGLEGGDYRRVALPASADDC